jgi:hypothetical protein
MGGRLSSKQSVWAMVNYWFVSSIQMHIFGMKTMSVIHQEGLAMPVDQELINIILNEGNPPPHKAEITAVSLLFKDLSYSAEKGGFIPSKYGLFLAMTNGI